jgi:hypothetical protein
MKWPKQLSEFWLFDMARIWIGLDFGESRGDLLSIAGAVLESTISAARILITYLCLIL